jgi:SAM-dependent methyltransferase
MTKSDGTPGLGSADWAGETSQRWAAQAGRLEAMLAPVDDILLPAAGIATGERSLDVGCGCGVTTRAVAALTGPSGAVTGLDISPTLITEAQTIPLEPDSAPVAWIAADAAAHPFPPDAFDVVVSRFGIMFFEDPVAAFANLRSGVRSGGRLVAAVWQRQDASEFQWLSVQVATRVAADHGVTLRPSPPDSGPFAYGTCDHTGPILEAAGWVDINVEPHTLPLYVGGPGTTPELAVEMGRQVGPFGMLLRDVPTPVADTIAAALVEEMQARWDGTGVALTAAIAIVTARRP